MGKRRLRIDQGRIIPLYPRLFVTGGLVALLIYLMDQSSKPDLTFMTGLVLGSVLLHAAWTTRKILEVDQDTAVIKQYYWLIGLKLRNLETPGKGTEILLRKMKRSEKAPGKFPWKVFLRLTDGSEVFVISRGFREDCEKVAQSIGKKLDLEVKKE